MIQVNRVALPPGVKERLPHPHQNARLPLCTVDVDYLLGLREDIEKVGGSDEPLVITDDRLHVARQLRATAREHGLEVHAEAARHDVDGLVEALLADAAR